MKFWHKIFIGSLIIFIIAFDAGAIYLTSYAYNFNRNRETENCVREQEVILSSADSRITSAENFYPDASHNNERLVAIMQPLSDYYNRQGVLLALFDGDVEIYADISIHKELINLESAQSKNIMEDTYENKRYVFVASQLPNYTHLTFIYARDISQIDDFRTNIGRVFTIMNAVVLVFLGGSIYILLKHMTKPISELTAITAKIADGAYEKRAEVKRGDELGVLADSFNRMAASVEDHMTQLTTAAEDKQQFIDDLSHEMKTPLTSILGYSDYLQNANSTEEERITAAGHLHRMALRLKNLSDKLLVLTSLRGEPIELQTVNVPVLLDALTEMTRPILAPRNQNLVILSDLKQMNGDETLLLSMLQNLVGNAARASKEGSSITVRGYEKNGIVIEVTDTGCGIEQGEIKKITAPFYRADKSRSREFGGVGLGLSIVSQIADLHGAHIEIESELARGTTVRICFTTP